MPSLQFSSFFFFNEPATPEIYPLSLHAALPIFEQKYGAIHDVQSMEKGCVGAPAVSARLGGASHSHARLRVHWPRGNGWRRPGGQTLQEHQIGRAHV